MNPNMRVAIVHDYLNQMGGAERVVAVLHRMFPEAPIYTTIVDNERLLPELRGADIRTTWMQHIPGILKRFKLFFWLYPFAVRSMNLRDYDLVISSSSAYAIGAPIKANTVHMCYCHTPMRFAWDFATYMEDVKIPALLKWLAESLTIPLRKWDRMTSGGTHLIVANSTIVQQRIKSHYGKLAQVIFPPVHTSRFSAKRFPHEDYFLVVSRLVSYKRIDLAVKACSRLELPLVIVGDGPDRERLESLAGYTVKFMGRLPDEQVVHNMQQCRALLFPGIEDFGITPLEVNACGKPVIAYRGGGALDTVIPELNGLFFDQQTVDSLSAALQSFDQYQWDSFKIRQHAEKFDESRFTEELFQCIREVMNNEKAV